MQRASVQWSQQRQVVSNANVFLKKTPHFVQKYEDHARKSVGSSDLSASKSSRPPPRMTHHKQFQRNLKMSSFNANACWEQVFNRPGTASSVRHRINRQADNYAAFVSFLKHDKWLQVEEVYMTRKFNVCQLPVLYLSIPEVVMAKKPDSLVFFCVLSTEIATCLPFICR